MQLHIMHDAPDVRCNKSQTLTDLCFFSSSISYDCCLPTMDDYSKAPPPMPPHLNLTLLNVNAPVHDDNKSLPRPQHVILDHIYCQNFRQVSVA